MQVVDIKSAVVEQAVTIQYYTEMSRTKPAYTASQKGSIIFYKGVFFRKSRIFISEIFDFIFYRGDILSHNIF